LISIFQKSRVIIIKNIFLIFKEKLFEKNNYNNNLNKFFKNLVVENYDNNKLFLKKNIILYLIIYFGNFLYFL